MTLPRVEEFLKKVTSSKTNLPQYCTVKMLLFSPRFSPGLDLELFSQEGSVPDIFVDLQAGVSARYNNKLRFLGSLC